MKIISKHVLKNIFGKPGRTLLVLFCITLCSFIALLSFDISNTIRNIVSGMMGQLVGTTDIQAQSDEEIDFSDSQYPANTTMELTMYDNIKYVHDEETYYIANPKYITAYTMDLEKAVDMGILKTDTLEISDGECVVSENYLEFYNVNVGDKVTLQDKNQNEYEFKIKGIATDLGQVFTGFTVIVTKNDMGKINPDNSSYMYLIDLEDNSVARNVFDQLREEYPRASFMCIAENEELENLINNTTRLLMLFLAICILMVIFVTISVSDRVICERMAVIGTFRSLGFSRNATTGILLSENVIYGVVGSLIGVGLYSVARMPILTSLLIIEADAGLSIGYGSISMVNVIFVIACAVLIECACSIKEIVKAVKTPIRDIIFSTKDAEYRFNKVSTIIGLLCVVIAVVMLFIKDVFMCQIVAIVCVELAVSMLSPYFFTLVGKGFSKLFDKSEKIIPALAAKETYTKKNTVGASILITTVVSLCVAVMCYSSSERHIIENTDYLTADLYISSSQEITAEQYIDNLPGVEEVEYLILDSDTMVVNGTYIDLISVYNMNEGGFKYIDLEDCPKSDFGTDEVYVSTALLKKCNLKIGESYEFEFMTDSPLPYTKTLKIAGKYYDTLSSMFVNHELYSKIYNMGESEKTYIKCSNPEETKDTIMRYSGLKNEAITTRDELIEKLHKDSEQMGTLINAILIIGCCVTFIGAAGNLLIGFESRKREGAVLLSTSLTRKKLCGAYLLESFFASLSAIILALPIGFSLLIPINNVFEILNTGEKIFIDFGSIALTMLIMLIAFTLTAVQPIRALRKMKLAEQLKYE